MKDHDSFVGVVFDSCSEETVEISPMSRRTFEEALEDAKVVLRNMPDNEGFDELDCYVMVNGRLHDSQGTQWMSIQGNWD